MPKITLTAGVIASIPANKINAVNARKVLVFTLVSGDAVWGWNADVTASGDSTAGIPMVVATPVTQAGDDMRLDDAVYFLSAAGGVVNWQAQLK